MYNRQNRITYSSFTGLKSSQSVIQPVSWLYNRHTSKAVSLMYIAV